MLHEKPHGIPHIMLFTINDIFFIFPFETIVVVDHDDVSQYGMNNMPDCCFLFVGNRDAHTKAGYGVRYPMVDQPSSLGKSAVSLR